MCIHTVTARFQKTKKTYQNTTEDQHNKYTSGNYLQKHDLIKTITEELDTIAYLIDLSFVIQSC